MGQLVDKGGPRSRRQLAAADRDGLVLEGVVGQGSADTEGVEGSEQVDVPGHQPERPHQPREVPKLGAVVRVELLLVGRDRLLELGRGEEPHGDGVLERQSPLLLRDLRVRRHSRVPVLRVGRRCRVVCDKHQGRRHGEGDQHRDGDEDHPQWNLRRRRALGGRRLLWARRDPGITHGGRLGREPDESGRIGQIPTRPGLWTCTPVDGEIPQAGIVRVRRRRLRSLVTSAQPGRTHGHVGAHPASRTRPVCRLSGGGQGL